MQGRRRSEVKKDAKDKAASNGERETQCPECRRFWVVTSGSLNAMPTWEERVMGNDCGGLVCGAYPCQCHLVEKEEKKGVSNEKKTSLEQLLSELGDLASEMSEDELRVLLLIAKRLDTGRQTYGELCFEGDNRNFVREALEEVADAFVYLACDELRKPLKKPGTVVLSNKQVDALVAWANGGCMAYGFQLETAMRVAREVMKRRESEGK